MSDQAVAGLSTHLGLVLVVFGIRFSPQRLVTMIVFAVIIIIIVVVIVIVGYCWLLLVVVGCFVLMLTT